MTLNKAFGCFAKQNFSDCVDLCAQSVKSFQDSPQLFYVWGRSLHKTGKYQSSCEQYRKAVELSTSQKYRTNWTLEFKEPSADQLKKIFIPNTKYELSCIIIDGRFFGLAIMSGLQFKLLALLEILGNVKLDELRLENLSEVAKTSFNYGDIPTFDIARFVIPELFESSNNNSTKYQQLLEFKKIFCSRLASVPCVKNQSMTEQDILKLFAPITSLNIFSQWTIRRLQNFPNNDAQDVHLELCRLERLICLQDTLRTKIEGFGAAVEFISENLVDREAESKLLVFAALCHQHLLLIGIFGLFIFLTL